MNSTVFRTDLREEYKMYRIKVGVYLHRRDRSVAVPVEVSMRREVPAIFIDEQEIFNPALFLIAAWKSNDPEAAKRLALAARQYIDENPQQFSDKTKCDWSNVVAYAGHNPTQLPILETSIGLSLRQRNKHR